MRDSDLDKSMTATMYFCYILHRMKCGKVLCMSSGLLLVLQERIWMAQSLWSLAAIPVAFALFVYKNGGVVVGDKAHHVPVQHFMQIPYLLLFTAGCLAAVHFTPHRCFLSFTIKLQQSSCKGLQQHSRCQ